MTTVLRVFIPCALCDRLVETTYNIRASRYRPVCRGGCAPQAERP